MEISVEQKTFIACKQTPTGDPEGPYRWLDDVWEPTLPVNDLKDHRSLAAFRLQGKLLHNIETPVQAF